MKVGVVILNWNGAALLRQFLPSVVKFSEGADIYVADNASSDDSLQVLEAEFPSVTIIGNTENFGFAKGYNEALKHVDADVFALVNSDVEVTENWLGPIIAAFEESEEVSIIQPKICDWKKRDSFEYAGAAGGFIDKYGFAFCRGRIFDTVEKDHGQYDDADIFWASGACYFIRSKMFREMHGFDEGFFAHMEEIDLCWRAFNLGYRAKYIAASKVYHVGGATLEQGNPHKTYLNFRNSLLMMVKNLPSEVLATRMLARLVLDGIAGVRFLASGKPRHCLAVVCAHFAFYRGLRRHLKKRAAHQRPDYYYLSSIIISYYFSGRKTFRSLF